MGLVVWPKFDVLSRKPARTILSTVATLYLYKGILHQTVLTVVGFMWDWGSLVPRRLPRSSMQRLHVTWLGWHYSFQQRLGLKVQLVAHNETRDLELGLTFLPLSGKQPPGLLSLYCCCTREILLTTSSWKNGYSLADKQHEVRFRFCYQPGLSCFVAIKAT